jgi:hypothetical protein
LVTVELTLVWIKKMGLGAVRNDEVEADAAAIVEQQRQSGLRGVAIPSSIRRVRRRSGR